jgi:hypothetical protein
MTNWMQKWCIEKHMKVIVKNSIKSFTRKIKSTCFGYYVGNVLNALTDCVVIGETSFLFPR